MNHPILYEINTRCWLRGLSERQGGKVTLADVPESEFVRWQRLGFTHLWLMGVWTTGLRSRSIALKIPSLQKVFSKVLPGWTGDDLPGSPYAIGSYEVSPALGGEAGLKIFREKLNAFGIKLLLDFVPNHTGLDFSWVAERPELFVQSPVNVPGTFEQQTSAGLRWLSHGKDPNFPPWSDTVQLDYRLPETRVAMIELLQSVARRCDGVRCDMAMLLLNAVFNKTWAHFPTPAPAPSSEFWAEAIPSIKKASPNFLFLAEAYWGLESRLESLGFDYTYDKAVYDRIIDRHYADLQKYLLGAPPAQLARGSHFLENHDERRIATILTPAEHRAAALLVLSLPGMRFLYEGQLEGWLIQVPVHLGRWPKETTNAEILGMYEQMLRVLKDSAVGHGEWNLLRPMGWPDNNTAQNMIVIQWQNSPAEFDLVVVNLASHSSQCRVQLAIKSLAAHDWEMRDLLGKDIYQRHGGDLEGQPLHFDLPANGAQLFHFK